MCGTTCTNGLTDKELMMVLEEMGYDYRLSNETKEDAEKDLRSIHELGKNDFDWSGAYEAAINEGYVYCVKCQKWLRQ